MRSIYRTALLTLVLALATGAVTASGAYAAQEWYMSSTPAAAEWQQGGKALSETRTTTWKGKVDISDWVLETTVECEGAGEGTVGVGAAGKFTAWTLSKCAFLKAGACSKLENVKAVDLPWSTELVYSRGATHDVVKGEGGPGFQFTCTAFGIKFPDKCTMPTLSASLGNATGGVNASFSPEATCVFGSMKDSGRVEGSGVIEATTGGKLEVAGKEGPFTKLSSSLEVKRSGKLTLEDQGWGKTSITCQVQTTGTIEAGGKGKINSYSASGCTSSGCESLGTFTVINLPWKTELHEREGLIDESIVSGGSGTPQLRFTCVQAGVKREDTCGVNVSPFMLNGPLGNVDALFGENRVNCSMDTHEGEGVWRGELVVEHPASVAEIEVS
jgi:hypothetical protein